MLSHNVVPNVPSIAVRAVVRDETWPEVGAVVKLEEVDPVERYTFAGQELLAGARAVANPSSVGLSSE